MAKDDKLNQLNLTVVALVALVAIVGLVALVMNAASLKTVQLSTGSRLASADPLTNIDAAKTMASEQNVVGGARYSCSVLNYIIDNPAASENVKAWAGSNLGSCN